MPGVYETLRAAKRGEQAMRDDEIQRAGMEIADREIAQAQMDEEARIMADARARQGQEQAYSLGARDAMAASGLGLGSQTVGSIQQQQVAEQDAMRNDAVAIIQELEAAKAQGATDEQIQAMVGQIPPELTDTVRAVRQEMIAQQPPPQGSHGVAPAAPENAITAYAKALLREQ